MPRVTGSRTIDLQHRQNGRHSEAEVAIKKEPIRRIPKASDSHCLKPYILPPRRSERLIKLAEENKSKNHGSKIYQEAETTEEEVPDIPTEARRPQPFNSIPASTDSANKQHSKVSKTKQSEIRDVMAELERRLNETQEESPNICDDTEQPVGAGNNEAGDFFGDAVDFDVTQLPDVPVYADGPLPAHTPASRIQKRRQKKSTKFSD